ncbi:toll/interleukin-1 receptor domain-containing protein [Nitrosopumilus adriaticus]|uniref:toll/interleukin-1 receptor domain-containing protein n=1 Tax=Nitrosopumilus adriaticus TaxID=1580092 RepID=UPI00352EA9A4
MTDYLGFISYSHADAKDLTEDLDKYLQKHQMHFSTVYDGHIPEGEPLETIKEKLRQCSIFILIVTTDSLTSDAIAEEVEIAKEKQMKIITCKNKYVKKDWHELPWGLSKYKGLEFENMYELRRNIVYSLGNIIDEIESENTSNVIDEETKEKFQEIPAESKTVLKSHISSMEKSEKSDNIVIQTDKSVYLYNSDMICTVINTDKKSINPINLVIFDEEKNIVYKNSIPINPNGNGIYQEIINVGGDGWNDRPGSEYIISAEHEGSKAALSFYLSDFGAIVELDQKVYTWTDKVQITIVAPDLVIDPNRIERIGNNPESTITILTRSSKLENYELVETNPGSGIFVGEIRLTGFRNYDARGDGQMEKTMGSTSGQGPTDGLLECGNDDGLNVILKTKRTEFNAGALIRWNIGEIQWEKSNYNFGDTGKLIVIDPDINLNPNMIEIIPIRVWSDSDPVGIETIAVETGKNTGIFVSDLQFGNKTTQSSLKVTKGDTITAEYVDRTLPDPYQLGNNLAISSTTIIGELYPPLERIELKNPRILDKNGHTLTSVSVEQTIQIASDLSNITNYDQKFAYLVSIKAEDDVPTEPLWITGTIMKDQSFTSSISWTPKHSGKYFATIYVWKSVDNPEALSPPISLEIEVL